MSMSTFITGFKPADEYWHQMKAVYDACEAAGVSVPIEVENYFEGPPDPNGVEVHVEHAIRRYTVDTEERFEVTLAEIPADVKILRFTNSY